MATKFNKGETVEIKWKATTANTTEEARIFSNNRRKNLQRLFSLVQCFR